MQHVLVRRTLAFGGSIPRHKYSDRVYQPMASSNAIASLVTSTPSTKHHHSILFPLHVNTPSPQYPTLIISHTRHKLLIRLVPNRHTNHEVLHRAFVLIPIQREQRARERGCPYRDVGWYGERV